RSMCLCKPGFEAAPSSPVPSYDDLAFDIDSAPREILIVIRHAVVDVDEVAGNVAIGAINVVRTHAVRPGGGRITRDGWLLERRDELCRRDELERVVLERRV